MVNVAGPTPPLPGRQRTTFVPPGIAPADNPSGQGGKITITIPLAKATDRKGFPMEMTGERRIRASRDVVWRALNTPDVLKACIPGCEELEQTSDTTFEGKVKQKVGPVSARFQVNVTLSDIVEAESYRISGEGKGGAAGFAKGGAAVELKDDGEGTLLSYDAEAKVGGKLAQLGSRIIDGYAKKMADAFFDRFKEAVEPPEAGEAETEAAAGAKKAAEQAAPEKTVDAGSGDTSGGKKKGWFRRLFG